MFENQDRIIPIVFISNNTFSAAIINALNILDYKNSVSIGKKTAGAPTKFGQTVEIVLPNSKIVLSVSTKYFEEKGYEFGDDFDELKKRISASYEIVHYSDRKSVV